MGITTMEQFNERVQEIMEMHNERFGIDPLEMSREELDRILTRRLKRESVISLSRS